MAHVPSRDLTNCLERLYHRLSIIDERVGGLVAHWSDEPRGDIEEARELLNEALRMVSPTSVQFGPFRGPTPFPRAHSISPAPAGVEGGPVVRPPHPMLAMEPPTTAWGGWKYLIPLVGAAALLAAAWLAASTAGIIR